MNIYIKSFLAALVFSFLFYSKQFGLNLVLISIFVSLLLIPSFKGKSSWGYYLAYIFTALMVFMDPSGFKIFIHFMTFVILIGKQISLKNSLYISWFTGLVNMVIASIFHLNIYLKNPNGEKRKLSPKTINYIKGISLAFVLILIFSILYQHANPVFENLVAQINLDFISVPWVFFTLSGYFIFLHILRPYYPKNLLELDLAQKNSLTKPEAPFTTENLISLASEKTLGSIIFIALNALLAIFLITDIIYLLDANVLSNEAYSQSVHQGIYALLFSIICAILIILYFFRGNLNFFQENQTLKKLTYSWIILNTILVLFTCYKNYAYIQALGLTYKRIGVFVYLILTVIGLSTTYIKVAQIKSFVYLVRTNITAMFLFLLLSATIPWDRAITSYNLSFIKNPDISYLINLGESNSSQLHRFAYDYNGYTTTDQLNRITRKYDAFSKKQSDKKWQEYTIYQVINTTVK